jgi:hypothetical protein
LKPLPKELQHPSIRYAPLHESHQLLVVDAVEKLLDVDFHHVSVVAPAGEADRFQRVRRAALGPKPIRAVFEVRFKDRLNHELRRRLHHSIAHRGDPQRPLRTVRLRDVLAPYRLRPVLSGPEAMLYILEKLFHASLLDHRQGLPVDAGSPLVHLDPLPRLCQNVTPADPVVQRVETARTASLGGHVKPAPELSDFVRRVVGPLGHALALIPSHRRDQSRALLLQRRSPPSSLL